MTITNLTPKEKKALKIYWQMKIKVKDGNVLAKKGECWGILCSLEEGKTNAQMLIERSKKK